MPASSDTYNFPILHEMGRLKLNNFEFLAHIHPLVQLYIAYIYVIYYLIILGKNTP